MQSNATQWLWQADSWPILTYDAPSLQPAITAARVAQGRLLGKAEAVSASGLSLSPTQHVAWTNDALATSAIEGEFLNLDAVRSSVARRLGIDSSFTAAVPRNIEGLLDVMEDAAANWKSDLTNARLYRWQAALFDGEFSVLRKVRVGAYRTHDEPMQIVSGPIGRETVHYEAPPSSAVPAEMRAFCAWFNQSRKLNAALKMDGIVRAGLAHCWFETIHPFEDGNGRVGRAIIDMALAQDVQMPFRLHGVSTEMRRAQKQYYTALNTAQRSNGDVTPWLLWFLEMYRAACVSTIALIDAALQRAIFWAQHRQVALNARQRKVINKLLEAGAGGFEGGLTSRKYIAMTGAAAATATRDLTELSNANLLTKHGAGRSIYYDLALNGWGWKPASK